MAIPTLSTTATDAAATHVRGRPLDLLRLIRPVQWPKNLLVMAAPAAGGVLDQAGSVLGALVALLAFTAASASVYAVNDVVDADVDREHPLKRMRPVASGRVAVQRALTVAAVAAALATALAGLLGWATLVVVLTYLALSSAYALKLKHVAVLDIVVVATGFLLRALAGATASDVKVSSWFLLVSLFGALYLVAAKRTAEATRGLTARTRTVLAQYPREWLNQVVGVALTGAMLSYAMWAFQDVGTDVFVPALAGSVGPFFVALLRYGLLVANGGGEVPERDLFADRTLLVAGATWAALVAIGVYAG